MLARWTNDRTDGEYDEGEGVHTVQDRLNASNDRIDKITIQSNSRRASIRPHVLINVIPVLHYIIACTIATLLSSPDAARRSPDFSDPFFSPIFSAHSSTTIFYGRRRYSTTRR